MTTEQEADEVFAGMKKTGEVLTGVSLSGVKVLGSVQCSDYELKEARLHAEKHFPGKLVVQELGRYHRMCKSTLHHKTMAEHYDDEEMFPLRYSSAKGALYFRALPIRRSYECAVKCCVEAQCEIPRWEDYLKVVSTSDYKAQKPLNCVCAMW